MSRALLAAAIAAASLAAVACTSSGGSTPSTPTSASVTALSSTATPSPPSTPSALPSTAASSTAPRRPSSSAPSSTTPPPRTTSAAPTPTGPATCTAAQLKATGEPGGAAQGLETAGVVFTNTSSRTCVVRGYPFAQLRRNGKPLGNPAGHNGGAVRSVVLKPGVSAQSLLTAVSTCQGAVSDHARIQAPGAGASSDVVIQLRNCTLSIAPLEAA